MPKYKFTEIAINSTEKKKPTEADKDTYIGLEHLDSGTLTVSRWGAEVAPIGEKLVMKKGDVLFGKRRAYQKKVGIAPFDGIFSAHGMVLRPREEVITKEYFPLFISSDYFLNEAIRISVGSLSPTVNWKDLKDLEFFIPSIEEQRRLTPVVWAAIEARNAYKTLISRTDELVKSQFIEMISQSKRVNVLGDYIKRCTPKRCGDRTLPVLSVTKERAIVFQESRFDSTVASVDKSNYIVAPRGYIVQGIHIDEGNFGYQNLVDEGIVSPAYKLWQIISSDVVPELLEFYLRSEKAIEYYTRNFQGTTVARRQTIKAEDLLNMPLNLPEKQVQQAFWAFVEQSDKSKFVVSNRNLSSCLEIQLKILWDGEKQLLRK